MITGFAQDRDLTVEGLRRYVVHVGEKIYACVLDEKARRLYVVDHANARRHVWVSLDNLSGQATLAEWFGEDVGKILQLVL